MQITATTTIQCQNGAYRKTPDSATGNCWLANAIGIAAGTGLWALDKPRANITADMLALAIAIAAARILIAPYGAMGAVTATLAASAMGCLFRQAIFH